MRYDTINIVSGLACYFITLRSHDPGHLPLPCLTHSPMTMSESTIWKGMDRTEARKDLTPNSTGEKRLRGSCTTSLLITQFKKLASASASAPAPAPTSPQPQLQLQPQPQPQLQLHPSPSSSPSHLVEGRHSHIHMPLVEQLWPIPAQGWGGQ